MSAFSRLPAWPSSTASRPVPRNRAATLHEPAQPLGVVRIVHEHLGASIVVAHQPAGIVGRIAAKPGEHSGDRGWWNTESHRRQRSTRDVRNVVVGAAIHGERHVDDRAQIDPRPQSRSRAGSRSAGLRVRRSSSHLSSDVRAISSRRSRARTSRQGNRAALRARSAAGSSALRTSNPLSPTALATTSFTSASPSRS